MAVFQGTKASIVEDVHNEVIKFDDYDQCWTQDSEVISIKEIYGMRPEYSLYLLEKLEERLTTIHKKLKEESRRANRDLEFLEEFMQHNENNNSNDKQYNNKYYRLNIIVQIKP